MYVGFHVNCVHFCQFLTKRGHGRQILVKSPNIKFYENPSLGTDLFLADRQTDRQTGCREGMMKMQCAFRSVLRSCLRHVHVAPIRTYHITLLVMSNTGDVSYMIKQTMTGRRGITMDSFKLIGVNIFQIYTTKSYLNLI
jgi:hypothetical protein